MDLRHILNLKKITTALIYAVLLSISSVSVSAQEHAGGDSVSAAKVEHGGEESISEIILHHIADSHEWHFWGHGEHKVSIALPVILWTNNGLVSFLYSKHDEDEYGTTVFTENGHGLVNYHGKFFYAAQSPNQQGEYIEFDKSNAVINDKPLDISITKNVVSLFISVIVLLVVFIGVAGAYKKREGKAPKGLQSVLEPIILFIRDDIARPQLGYRYVAFMPYLLTVFFFVWLNNLMGLLPFFPGGANLTGNIAVTLMLAACTFVLTTVNGNKNYWGHVFKPHVPWWLYPLMIPVEIIGLFTKPIALMIRLFANITAGHILILSLISLIFILKSVFVAGIAVPFVIFISVIELVVGFIQAFIFTILSALFIGMAVEEQAAH